MTQGKSFDSAQGKPDRETVIEKIIEWIDDELLPEYKTFNTVEDATVEKLADSILKELSSK